LCFNIKIVNYIKIFLKKKKKKNLFKKKKEEGKNALILVV